MPLKYFPHLAACEIAVSLGLLVGIWWPILGLAAGIGLIVYFVGAIVSHVRVGDLNGIGAAVLILTISVASVVLRAMSYQTGTTATTHGASSQVRFTVAPSEPLIDEPVRIVVGELAANSPTILRAKSEAQDHLWWRSEIVINSGPDGQIDLGAKAPEAGSYQGIDAMGIFWSMKPDKEPKNADHSFFTVRDFFQPIDTNIEVVEAGQVVGSVTIERRYSKAGIKCVRLKDAGLHGILGFPDDGKQHPGILVIGGSEAGAGLPGVTVLLASHGFTAVSLSYLGERGQPATLQNIPLEYFKRAVDWILTLPEMRSRPIAVFGVSRGTEVALQLAAMSSNINAVVARSPSFVRWEGISAHGLPGGPAWTLSGQPLPYIPNRIPLWFATQYLWERAISEPVRQTPLFSYDLNIFGATDPAEIPVENIHGPILLLSGKDDQIWPGDMMADKLMARLKQHRHAYNDVHFSYDQAGHWIPCEYLPTAGDFSGLRLVIGGTAEGVAKAQQDSWPRILGFLAQAATQRPSSN
jgi:pimeloyl-ACP methyl ester carboxylesterase